MKELLNYIAQYDSAFIGKIRGASDAAIARLEQLAGDALPPQYCEFLAVMGENTGGFEFSNDDAMSITEIMRFYEEKARGEADVPANCVVIAWGGAGYEEQQLSLECGPPDRSRVLVSDHDRLVGLYADSFAALLFRRAFEQYPFMQQPCRGVYSLKTPQPLLPRAAALAATFDFRGQPCSDSIVFCGTRGDGLLIVIAQFSHRGLTVKIAGPSKGAIRAAGEPFEKQMGASFSHW